MSDCALDQDLLKINRIDRITKLKKSDFEENKSNKITTSKSIYEYYKELIDEKYLYNDNDDIKKTKKSEILYNKKIGIWIIPKLLIHYADIYKIINYVNIPKYCNENMRAQKGVFINYLPNEFPFNNKFKNEYFEKYSQILEMDDKIIEDYNLLTYFKNNKICSIDEMLVKPKNFYDNDFNDYNKLINYTGKPRLFTLPWNEVPMLKLYLDQLNMNWTKIIPSLEGAKKQVDLTNVLLFCE